MSVDFEQVQKEMVSLIAAGRLPDAEAFLLREKPGFTGRSLGRWYWLFAAVARRLRPDDQAGFSAACAEAAKLLQGDHVDLCELYLSQMAASMSWRDWRAARTYIRRMRALFRRHPDLYNLQRLQGAVLANEGMIERIHGNYSRAIDCLIQSVEAMERYLYPPYERSRRMMACAALTEVADCYLWLGNHAKAIEHLARIDPSDLDKDELPRYYYVQSRYWLNLSRGDRAAEWFRKIGPEGQWQPDWPVLLLELEAELAAIAGRTADAIALFNKAIEDSFAVEHEFLMTRLVSSRKLLERVLSR